MFPTRMTPAGQLEAHRPALVGHCYRMLGSAAEAEDAVQETLVRAWRALEGFDGRASLRTWACMVVSDLGYVMLLDEAFYRTFTKREPCDTTRQNEGLFALSCESRAEVDALVRKALDAGGSQAMPAVDHGFMYERSFYDPDGHHWELIWMDEEAARQGPPQALAS